jgi:putative lipoic acid-binding regulatory protein
MEELVKDLNKSERISFPVTYELKIIMDATIPDDVNKKNIHDLLEGLKIPHDSLRHRLSEKGRYMSFTYRVTISKYSVLKDLYEKLKALPGIKFAV